jgi:RNA polymerase sigma-70 factor, ECF subfamily
VSDFDASLGRIFREESGRSVATLVRIFGDIDIAEEAVQEAFVIAMQRWPDTGVPPNPGAWITTTARNRAIDRVRREATRHDRSIQSVLLHDNATTEASTEVGPVKDDRLRLIFTCCHPALATNTQIAMTLRLLGGLQTTEIARALLIPEPTVAQRIVRAKRKISANNIPYRVPADAELPSRLRAVLTVVYLIFNEGHTATSGDELVRDDLCTEGIRLARLLGELMPDEPEVLGLLALLLLTESRRPARTAPDGSMLLLSDQDRSRWSRPLIEEGQMLVRACLRRNQPGPYQIQAAINAVHSDAATAADTDWYQILRLYDQLLAQSPTAVVALNRAVVLAEVDGADIALNAVEQLRLEHYYLFHATRAELLVRLNRFDEAVEAYEHAASLTDNAAERAFLDQRGNAATLRGSAAVSATLPDSFRRAD